MRPVTAAVSAFEPPWWLPPLLTGAFVLTAAFIALGSLWLSDRRKLRREDQRQWDRELKESFIAVSLEMDALLRTLLDLRGEPLNVDEARRLLGPVARIVRHHGLSLRLTAPSNVIASLSFLHYRLEHASMRLTPDKPWSIPETEWAQITANDLREANVDFHVAVHSALRLPRKHRIEIEVFDFSI